MAGKGTGTRISISTDTGWNALALALAFALALALPETDAIHGNSQNSISAGVYAEPSHGHDGRWALSLKQTPHVLVTAKATIE